MKLLQLNSSGRIEASLSRQVGHYIREQLGATNPDQFTERNLVEAQLPFVSEAHIGAYYTPADQRTEEQQKLLLLSDQLIAELKEATHIIIAAPMCRNH